MMGKVVLNTHISGEAGVIRFAEYCNKHQPYIFFREVLKSDFGIDGEIELTRINEDRKIEPLGEIMKVQIKTTSSDNSYIRNEKTNSFEFYPRKEDLDYWNKYRKNGIEVLLVIYDQRNDRLYCKKITDTDSFIAREHLKTGKKKNTNAISFSKQDNLLRTGDNAFISKYSNSFANRVTFGLKEYLLSNFLKYHQHPKQLYVYECMYKNKKAIYEHIEQDEAPFFIVYDSLVYTFTELGPEFTSFKSKVLHETPAKLKSYITIQEEKKLRNHYVELLNEHLKDLLKRKKMAFQKDYRRFYFWIPRDQESVTISSYTRKRGQASQKTVVKKFVYGKLTFFRHIALECKHFFVGKDPYLIIQPKYFFTEDGKTPLAPKLITKLTNFLTAQEYNNHFCDWLHFWWVYLSNGEDELLVYEDPAYKNVTKVQKSSFYAKRVRITLSGFMDFAVDFGIATDKKDRRRAEVKQAPDTPENLLFSL